MLSHSRGARQRVLIVLLAAMAGCLTSSSAFAAKGGKTGGNSAPSFSLASEQVTNSNSLAPTWCLNEDDYRQGRWSGSLSGSFTTTEQLCDRNVDYANGMYWSAGGIGLRAELFVVGAVSDISITSPQGDAHHAVLVGSSTSRGVTTDHYQVCYVPAYEHVYNSSGAPLPGGAWTITVSGSFSSANYSVTGAMTDVQYQQTYCPVSQQNIL
jgi:hypothetical protein